MIPFAWCKILCAKTKVECVNDVTSIVSFFFYVCDIGLEHLSSAYDSLKG